MASMCLPECCRQREEDASFRPVIQTTPDGKEKSRMDAWMQQQVEKKPFRILNGDKIKVVVIHTDSHKLFRTRTQVKIKPAERQGRLLLGSTPPPVSYGSYLCPPPRPIVSSDAETAAPHRLLLLHYASSGQGHWPRTINFKPVGYFSTVYNMLFTSLHLYHCMI